MTKDNNLLFLFTLITVFEGLITGVNIAGISGVVPLIQESWEISDIQLGILVGILILGGCLGSYLGLSRLGRINKKQTLSIAAALLIISPMGCVLSPDINTLLIFRFTGGIGLGLIWVTTPIYISNLFPVRIKSSLLSYGYLAISIGILMAYIANYLLLTQINNWHLMLGVPLLFSIVYCVLIILIPASLPATPIQPQQTNRTLIDVILIGLQQLTGISIFFNYASSIFETAGLEQDMAFSQSVFIGIINLLFTISVIWFIKNAGTYSWLIWGSLGMTFSSLYMAYIFAVPAANGLGFMIAIFCYIGSFNFSTRVSMSPSTNNASYKKISETTFLTVICFFIFTSLLLFPWLLNNLSSSVTFGVLSGFSLLTVFYILLYKPGTETESPQTQNNKIIEQ